MSRGWTALGGAELGASRQDSRHRTTVSGCPALETNGIDGLLVIGGRWPISSLPTAQRARALSGFLKIPMICLPASIDNNLPGSELERIGADTALNVIVEALDRIKQSAMAARRCFVVEVMGRHCGYLALMSGLAGGAERILPARGGHYPQGLAG